MHTIYMFSDLSLCASGIFFGNIPSAFHCIMRRGLGLLGSSDVVFVRLCLVRIFFLFFFDLPPYIVALGGPFRGMGPGPSPAWRTTGEEPQRFILGLVIPWT